MNADKIVRALKWLAKETEFVFAAENLNGAAAVIESLQAQLSKLEKRIAAEGFSDLETMISKYKTVMLAANELSIETDEEVEMLETKLSASQRRERAAVEFIKYLDRNYSGYMAEDERFSKWRGPQEAEKGE